MLRLILASVVLFAPARSRGAPIMLHADGEMIIFACDSTSKKIRLTRTSLILHSDERRARSGVLHVIDCAAPPGRVFFARRFIINASAPKARADHRRSSDSPARPPPRGDSKSSKPKISQIIPGLTPSGIRRLESTDLCG
ncbi:hypothetical protein C8R44DRAFT_356602 [Mycena epipterygia]|nr:hypothetical protein C8R44DRAFT_356602 [Mycena epipterygia]